MDASTHFVFVGPPFQNMPVSFRQHIRALSHGFSSIKPWLFVLCVICTAGAILSLSRQQQHLEQRDVTNPIFQTTAGTFEQSLAIQASSTPKIQEIQTILSDRGLSPTIIWGVFHIQFVALFIKETNGMKDFSIVWKTKNRTIPAEPLVYFALSRLYPGTKSGLLADHTLTATYTTAKTKVSYEAGADQTVFTIPSETINTLFLKRSQDVFVLSSTTTPFETSFLHTDEQSDGFLKNLRSVLDFLTFPY
jgi:hypothetical protein